MEFKNTLSNDKLPGDPEHDPAGDPIQTHELESGELLLTFSQEWADTYDWRVGDKLLWSINEETGALSLTCPEAEERKALQAEADMRRQAIADLERMDTDGAA